MEIIMGTMTFIKESDRASAVPMPIWPNKLTKPKSLIPKPLIDGSMVITKVMGTTMNKYPKLTGILNAKLRK